MMIPRKTRTKPARAVAAPSSARTTSLGSIIRSAVYFADPVGDRWRPALRPVSTPVKGLLESDETERSLVGGSHLVDSVVVRVRDVSTTSRIYVLLDEVQQVAVGDRGDAGDAEVADVSDMHRGRRDLCGRPRGPGGAQREVQRLRGVQIPFASRRVVGVDRRPGAATGVGLTEWISWKDFRSA